MLSSAAQRAGDAFPRGAWEREEHGVCSTRRHLAGGYSCVHGKQSFQGRHSQAELGNDKLFEEAISHQPSAISSSHHFVCYHIFARFSLTPKANAADFFADGLWSGWPVCRGRRRKRRSGKASSKLVINLATLFLEFL
jgi:hypothetical protein